MASKPIPASEVNKGADQRSSVTVNSPAKSTPSNPRHYYCSFEDMDEFKSTYKMVQNKRIQIDGERIVETDLEGVGHVMQADVEINGEELR